MHRLLPKVLSLCLALALLLPMLLVAPSIGLADSPTPNWLASIDEALSLGENASAAQRVERVNVALTLAGAPVAKTYIALKASASKADLAAAQKARQAELAKAQEAVVSALRSKASSARLMSQHQLLVNAVIVRVNRGEVQALRRLPGVVHVSHVPDAEIDLGNSVPHIGATRVAMELGITGRGVRVAILDSGIDYTHRNYGGPGTMEAYDAAVMDLAAITETITITATDGTTVTTTMFPTEKIPGGYDFLGDNWPNTQDAVLEPDPDPMDPAHAPYTGGHGSHVSGITAGMGVPNASFNGSIPADDTFGGTTIYHGVAPAAQLYAYKVCSSVSSSCSGVAMIQGFERAADPDEDGDMSDHVDALNMSIGALFGSNRVTQDAANMAAEAGIAVAISAGNSANFPYITGAPSIAEKVVSVANTFGPNNFAQVGLVDAPASLAGRRFVMVEQAWAPTLASVGGMISGELVYVGQGCPAAGTTPADPYLADPNGKIALIIRGACAVSLKSARAAQAGARAAIIYNNLAGDSPPSFAFGGGDQTIPALTVTLATGQLLRSVSGVQVTLSSANAYDLTDYINGSSSRGPSIVGNILKPDISAPGSNILSTGAGQYTGPANLSGTSMAAPHVAGVFALVKQAHPSWSAQEIMAATVNTANPIIQELLPSLTGRVIPLSWQGAGLVDAYKSVETTTLAHVPGHVASLSYGFHAVTTTHTATRQFMLANKGTTSRTYDLSFQAMQVPAGSSVTVSPSSVTLAAGETRAIDVTLTVAASGLADYGLFNQNVTNPALLDRSEISGFVHAMEEGGAGDMVSVPVHALARKASALAANSGSASLNGFGMDDAVTITVNNSSPNAGVAGLFSYLGADANEPDVKDQYDIRYVGVRPLTITTSTGPQAGLQFAVNLHGAPTLALETRINVVIDANRDGTDDYVVFNDDIGRRAGSPNGQNATYVQNLATNTVRGPFFFTNHAANSSNIALVTFASEIGLTNSNTAFNFYVMSWAWYVSDLDEDMAPETGYYHYNPAQPRFRHTDADGSVTVAGNGSATVTAYANARGFLGGDMADTEYEKGLLMLYDGNDVPTEAEAVTLTFPFNFTVQQQTFNAMAARTGYVVNRLGALDNQLGSGAMWTGVDNRSLNPLNYLGVAHFNLGAAGASVEFEEATLSLTGYDTSYVNPALDSLWYVDMLPSSVDANLGRATYNMIALAPAEATLMPALTDAALGKDVVNTFMLDSAAKTRLSEHVRTSGGVTFRTRAVPQYSQGMHLFAWDGRGTATAKAPVLSALTVTRLP